MPLIHILSSEVIAQIAAGQVIERPASVVKELLDNAIDSQATRITIELSQAGIDQIMVNDNGIGMELTDLRNCWHRHATSKISSLGDFSNLTTLGFRGEGLFSIASVSHLTISSRQTAQTGGWSIEIDHGQEKGVQPDALAEGTIVEVKQLFSEVPARKKFLKQPASELRYIVQIITQYAISFPGITFRLINDHKLIFYVPAQPNLSERIAAVLGPNLSNYLLPFSQQTPEWEIKGFLAHPSIARNSPHLQFLSINQRPIASRWCAQTIKEAYGGLLESTVHPLFILQIKVKPQTLDVNIHPRKEVISMTEQIAFLTQLKQIARHTLLSFDLTFSSPKKNNYPELGKSYAQLKDSASVAEFAHPKANQQVLQTLKQAVEAWETTDSRNLKEILQIGDLYLCCETKNGLLLIDQHAAHERILYQQYKQAYLQQTASSQPLDQPLTFDLPAADTQLLIENLELFEKLGFNISHLGDQSFSLTSLPKLLSPEHAIPVITEVIDDLIQDRTPLKLDRLTEKTIAYISCRLAIKQGDRLDKSQRENLLAKLSQTEQNYTCPHGRPTQILITWNELAKMFHRK